VRRMKSARGEQLRLILALNDTCTPHLSALKKQSLGWLKKQSLG